MPLHLIRELYLTFYNLRDRFVKFVHFRRISKHMNERWPFRSFLACLLGDLVVPSSPSPFSPFVLSTHSLALSRANTDSRAPRRRSCRTTAPASCVAKIS